MSNSTFNVTEPDSNDSITLVVGTDGTVTPDKETVQFYLSGRATVDINLMRMKKVEAGKVNVTLDTLTYINSDDVEDFEEMDEIARNLLNFRMDHDYTPLTSPTHEKPSDPIEDELAQTLSLLEEGTLSPSPAPQKEPLTKITKIVKGKKQTIFVTSAQKAKMISSGILKEKPAEALFKKPKIVKPKIEEKKEEEWEDEEEEAEDDDDSDFELDEEEEVRSRRRTRSGSERKKKEVKAKSPKVKEEPVKPPEEPPVPEVKPPEKKVTPKKDKKVPKPLPPDDFALFSTPDIIRRVGKEVGSPEKAVSPPKPAKIQPEIRSKSSNEMKSKRLSMEKERRLSLDSKKHQTGQVLVQDFNESLNNSDSSMQDDQLQPLPSAEDIRAIIQNENTKSFTANLVIPDIPENPMNLESGGLDLDQSILDNINTDMIPEDILMQVAQSLVDNTDLQNAIDKSIVDGNLVLDPTIQQTISESALIQALPNSEALTTPQPHLPQQQQPQAVAVSSTTMEEKDSPSKAGTQIIRPDGRVVVIPPIERPTTRSRNKKKEISPIRQIKPVHKPLDDQHVSGNELDTSGEEADEDDEDESEDDPNKLWCICNQPHNNRFMICCDTCEEWYHGKCVNVTKAMGQMMEHEGKEWICVYCKDSSLQRPKAAARRIRKASRTSTDSGGGGGGGGGGGVKRPASTAPSSSSSSTSLLEDKKTTGPGCVVCGKPSRNSSIYCSDTCILKHAQGVEKVVVFDRKSGKLLSGNNAPSAANLDKWLSQNPTYEVVRSTSKPSPAPSKPGVMTQTKLRLIKNTGNEGVSLAVHKKGVNIGVLHHAPKDTSNPSPPHILNSKQTPKKIVNITGLKIISKQSVFNNQAKIKVVPASPITPRPVLTSTPTKPPKMVQTKIIMAPTPKDKQFPQPQKTPKSRQAEVSTQPKQENLRETVRKTFFDQLSNRLNNVEDLILTEDELKGISNEIESQLYKCFGDTGQKYKNKYRSLIFNIKDQKNQTLWRRICEKSVNPYQLVRLSPDDLASQELALWREREAKHQLDMIKKSELELLNCSRQFVFKTHKGEQVFEDDRPKDQVTEVISGLGADSTTEKEEENEKEKRSSSRHKRDKSKDRGRSRDRSRNSKDSKERRKDRSSSKDHKKRSRSKDRGSRHSDRKRSRSRDRHKRSSHRSSRHKKNDEKTIEKLDKKSKEILEQLVDKHIVPPLEDRLWKHVPQEDIIPAPNVESDSDHEPSSTVTIPTPPRNPEPDEGPLGKGKDLETKDDSSMDADTGNKSPESKASPEPIWKGTINMVDVAQISITAHEVSGDCQGLGGELPLSLDIVGRISPDTVWDYIGKMKNSSGKTISVIRLTATNMEERMPYLALYSYLSSRNRLGVVKSVTKAVKDFYILPLAGNTPVPEQLLPLTGPGFEESRPALLLGILVRDKRKRTLDGLSSHGHTKRVRVDLVMPGTPPSSSRSYTPPPTRDPRSKINSVPLPVPLPEEPPEEDMDEPYSPEDSDPDVLPEPTSSRLNASDISSLLTGSVKASSFLEGGLNTQSFEPFSNKFDSIPGLDAPPSDSFDLQRKMAELDQRIAAQKAEIVKVSKDLVSSASDIGSSTLANIALPSNLQQILESIKTIGSKTDGADSQGENSNSSLPPSTDLTIPLLLPKLSSRSLTGGAPPLKPDSTIPLNIPKTKPKETEKSSSSVLSSLSEEDLIKKAAEMLGEVIENEEFVAVPPDPPIIGALPKRAKIDLAQPPIPGLED